MFQKNKEKFIKIVEIQKDSCRLVDYIYKIYFTFIDYIVDTIKKRNL